MKNFDDDLAEKLHKLLIHSKKTLAIAESCTGGLITHRLTNFSGSSTYLKLGIVVYSNQAKIDLVKVSRKLIQEKSEVCVEIAIELAKGIRNLLNTDIGLGITGIAGPTGGTENDPVGTAYVAVDFKGKIQLLKIQANDDRITNKIVFADNAIKLLQNVLSHEM